MKNLRFFASIAGALLVDLAPLLFFKLGAWKAKVAKFDGAFLINKNIGRFDVPVDEIRWMNEIRCAENVIENDFVVFFSIIGVVLLDQRLEVSAEEIHDNENFL